jgi:hypothetical protein
VQFGLGFVLFSSHHVLECSNNLRQIRSDVILARVTEVTDQTASHSHPHLICVLHVDCTDQVVFEGGDVGSDALFNCYDEAVQDEQTS